MAGKTKVRFVMWTSYHPAVGFEERGHNEFYFRSECGRWYARMGNFGNMVVEDRVNDKIHLVKGKMPEVEAFVNGLE